MATFKLVVALLLFASNAPDLSLQADPSNAEPIKFVLTFPSVYKIGQDFDFYLVLFENRNYSLPASFDAVLTLGSKNVTTQTFQQSAYGVQKHTFTNLASAGLPDTSSGGGGAADYEVPSTQVTVAFKSTGLTNWTDLSGSAYPLANKFVFIQTDKAIYKPAQNVKILVLALDRQMKPLAESALSVSVEDPNGNTIRQWNDQRLNQGMFAVNFSMSDFASLGEWTIKVDGSNLPEQTKSFTVEQYVLPKYEVNFEFPKSYWMISDNDASYKGYIRAKYTFGKTVAGNATIRLTNTGGCVWQYDSRQWDPQQAAPPIMTFTATLSGNGSPEDGSFWAKGLNSVLLWDGSAPSSTAGRGVAYTFMMPRQFGQESCQLSFDVNVTETLTGELIKSSATVMIYKAKYRLQAHDSVQKSIKPGIPFTMLFKVTQPDESPLTAPVDVLIMTVTDKSPKSPYGGTSNNCWRYQNAYGSDYAPPQEVFETKNYTVRTDSDGFASLTITPVVGVQSIAFVASIPSDPNVNKQCESRGTPSTVSGQSVSIMIDRPLSQSKVLPKVGESITFKIYASIKTSFVYFLLAQNGKVFTYQKVTQTVPSQSGTVFSYSLNLPSGSAPRASAAAWTVDTSSNEVLADAVEFKIDGLMQQNVIATFSPQTVKPGDPTTLTVKTSEPNSAVALLAVDKSVRLLKSGNDITLDDILGAVGESIQVGPYIPVMPMVMRCWRCGWWPSWVDSSNADSVFNGIGMTIKSNAITSAAIPPPWIFDRPGMANFGGPMVVMAGMAGNDAAARLPEAAPAPFGATNAMQPTAAAAPQITVRKNFPETWIWQVAKTNAGGEVTLSLESPDTITTWMLTALAVGDNKGFGTLDKPAELTVFQDFFVNLDVAQPTIIRGEQVEVKAVVFNYKASPITVSLLIKGSPDFDLSGDGGASFTSSNLIKSVQVPANGGSSLPVWIKPKKLGTIYVELSGAAGQTQDALRKEVTVEPEGEVKYANKPMLIRLATGTSSATSMSQTINVDEMLGSFANSVVPGSKLIQLQAVGDILGPALTNLGSQVRLPTGCGEQTMLTLAPNVYIYKYLKAANVLTPDVETRAVGFVDEGYQHELTYQREDGGFSAFGKSDSASSTWLTAFVLRCFHAAAKYMNTAIDANVFKMSWNFIKLQAKADGFFTEPGRVIHYDMKGGASGDINLATYIYTTYAEAGTPVDYAWSSLAQTRSKIVAVANDASNKNPYQLAITAYALSILPNDKSASLTALNRLMSVATAKDGSLYWNLTSTTKPAATVSFDAFTEDKGPTEIETAAYALLAMINHGQTDNAINVARFLMSKRNSLGGFMSTQDTVVGLQALSEIAPVLSGANTNFRISAVFNFADSNSTVVSTSFNINQANARLLQSFDPDRSRQALKTVAITVTGTGVGLIQLAMRYNVLNQSLLDSGDYTLIVARADARRVKRAGQAAPTTDVNVQLKACTKPKTQKARTGMVVMEVGIPTGFDFNLDGTIAANKASPGAAAFRAPIKMIESGNRKGVFYLDTLEQSLTGDGACVLVNLIRTASAVDVQPPMARVYAYYKPRYTNTVPYAFTGMAVTRPVKAIAG